MCTTLYIKGGVKLRVKWGLFLLFLSIQPSLAQAGGWHTYTNTNYLNDLKVFGSQVWWGTTGGVVRYDNADSSYAIYRNTEGLGGINVQAVEVDEEGNLWFGLANGILNRLRPNGEWRRASLGFGINYLRYHNRYIWAATEQALMKFDPQTWLSLEICEQPGAGLQRNISQKCLFFQGETLWVGTKEGVSYIDLSQTENLRDPAQWTFFTEDNSTLGKDEINTITSYQGRIYAGTGYGIYKFADSLWGPISGDWQDCAVFDLKPQSGKLLAVTTKGVWRWENGSLDSLKCPSSVPRRLSIGPQGELWVGTWGEGTLSYSDGVWQYPFKTQGPIGNSIADMALDDEGNLWLASPGYGMSGFDGKVWENFTPIADTTLYSHPNGHESPISNGVCAVAVDRVGNEWFGLWAGGVIKLDPEGNQKLYDEDNSPLRYSDNRYDWCTWNVVVNQIMVDGANNKYFANWYNGVAILDSSETNWLMYDRLISDRVLTGRLILDMLIDNQGGKWFAHRDGSGGSRGGVSYLVDDRGTPFDQEDDSLVYFLGESEGIPNNKVNCLAIDLDGSIWIGTDEGVSKYDPSLSKIPILGYRFLADYYDMIGFREVSSIEVDTKGNKWFGTSSGLLRYEEENFNWQEFTPKNCGLLDEKINCLLLDKARGHLWIGTDKGLSMYQLDMVEPKSSLSTLLVYPNPLLLSRSGAEVKFKNLTATSTVYIFSVNGELIREIPSEGFGLVRWKGRNQGGSLVAGGIYLWVVRDKNRNRKAGKIAVIR